MRDGKSTLEGGGGVGPRFPKVGVDSSEGPGKTVGCGGGEVEFFGVGDNKEETGGSERGEGVGGGVEFCAWDCLFPWDVGAEAGGVGAPPVGCCGRKESTAADFARGEVGVRVGPRPVV